MAIATIGSESPRTSTSIRALAVLVASILALPPSCGGEAGEVGAPAEDTEFRGGIAAGGKVRR